MFLFKTWIVGTRSNRPMRGGSNEYPQSMLLSRNKKNNVYHCKPQFYYIKVGFKGVKIICFHNEPNLDGWRLTIRLCCRAHRWPVCSFCCCCFLLLFFFFLFFFFFFVFFFFFFFFFWFLVSYCHCSLIHCSMC